MTRLRLLFVSLSLVLFAASAPTLPGDLRWPTPAGRTLAA